MIITPQKFENDIVTLLCKGYTPISFIDLINYVERGNSLPQNPIIITFDDGYLSNYEYAFPILKQYKAKACIFPIIRYSEENLSNLAHFNYLQAREMLSSGLIEIQPHTYDMHVKIDDSKVNEFYQDVLKAEERLSTKLNVNMYAFAFPYGIHNNATQSVLDSTNTKISLITDEGINIVHKGNLNTVKMMKRYTITQYTDMSTLLDKVDAVKLK